MSKKINPQQPPKPTQNPSSSPGTKGIELPRRPAPKPKSNK